MSDTDDEFRIRLGRIGNRKSRNTERYVRRVRHAAQKAGKAQVGSAGFIGSRIGRGHAQGTILASRSSAAGGRRVVIKTRIVRIKAGDPSAVRAHLRYVQRDGVTREGTPGKLYDAGTDVADGKAFTDRSGKDRHQFRFIVAPEDSGELSDLKPFVRDLMQQMESDLGTRLEWVAADHFNTGHPHTHIVMRGKDDRGKDLVIARDYIAHGMRARAGDLVTRELGPESEIEALRKLEHEVSAERFTRIDRAILRDAADGALKLAVKPERDPGRSSIRTGRLRTLERMGLADEIAPAVWRVAPEMEATLRRMGERVDIIKTMNRDLAGSGIKRAPADHLIFDPGNAASRVTGRVVAEGFSDELRDRRYVIVDGTDGRVHYADLGSRSAKDEPLVRNTIIEVRPHEATPRDADRTIAAIASRSRGIYSAELHHAADPLASSEFVESHVRRLEAMRRSSLVERSAGGSWHVGFEHLERAGRFEAINRAQRPARIAVLSWQSLEELPRATGATWLDRQLVTPSPARFGAGFGSDVDAALRARRQWLVEQNLAREVEGRVVYARNLLKVLERRELTLTGVRIAGETGLGYVEIKRGDRLEGTYRRMLTLNSGRFALIERSHDFVLVPWRPVLERAKGQLVVGAVGGEGISWSIGIKRGLGR